jgi:CRISPR-associated protein Cas5h
MATAFEITGPIAFYRKPYTTTSSVSYPIPTPTAVAGLIAAVLGLPNGSAQEGASAAYWREMSGTRIAIQRLNRTAWFSAAVNFWNTKDPQKSPHIQIKHQFVRNPHYRIFAAGGVAGALSDALAAGKTHFTPNLGAAYALAELHFLEEFDPVPIPTGEALTVHSALPFSTRAEAAIDFLATRGLMKDTFPFRMDTNRRVQETITLLYPAGPGQGIVLEAWEGLEAFAFHGETIAWLPAW